MNKEEIIENLKNRVLDLLTSKSIELVDIELKPSRERSVLIRFLVDKPQGITLNECTELNRLISDIIDNENIITQGYVLEVSSPGLDRPLKTKRDFERVKHKIVIALLKTQPQGVKRIIGRVVDVEDDEVLLDVKGEMQSILLDEIQKATLKIDFKRVEEDE